MYQHGAGAACARGGHVSLALSRKSGRFAPARVGVDGAKLSKRRDRCYSSWVPILCLIHCRRSGTLRYPTGGIRAEHFQRQVGPANRPKSRLFAQGTSGPSRPNQIDSKSPAEGVSFSRHFTVSWITFVLPLMATQAKMHHLGAKFATDRAGFFRQWRRRPQKISHKTGHRFAAELAAGSKKDADQ